MVDRRSRPVVKCQEPGCPFVGHWDDYCPQHATGQSRLIATQRKGSQNE